MSKPIFVDLEYLASVEHFVRFDVTNEYNHQILSLEDCCREVQQAWSEPHNKDKEWVVLLKELSSKKQVTDPNGKIDYEKLDDEHHLVKLDIPPYIIQKSGNFYAFDETTLVLGIQSKKSSNNNHNLSRKHMYHNYLQLLVMITNSLKVKEGYIHPQVWMDGSIDFGTLDIFNHMNIKLYYWYNLSEDKSGVARRIAHLMKEGQKILVKGGYGRKDYTYSPVRTLESCDCKIAENSVQALEYAQTHGINPCRIFVNDYQ
ncbi:MAG: hypothetical protein ACTSXD_10210 [Candidatus Heimdallarchaeaceae archaeon]